MLKLAKRVYAWSLAGFLALVLLYFMLSQTKDYPKLLLQDNYEHHHPYHYLQSRHDGHHAPTPLCGDGSAPTAHHTTARYVLGLNYWEQTNMALGNMFALNSFARGWSSRLVQPFIYNSRLYGLPHFLADHHWKPIDNSSALMLSLDEIFNMDNLNKLGKLHKLPKLVHFCEFLRFAKRQVILLHFISPRESREVSVLNTPDGQILKQRLTNEHIFECSQYQSIQNVEKQIMSSLNLELTPSREGERGESKDMNMFIIDKHYCVNMSIGTTPLKLAKQCSFSSDNLTVLVLNWRGLGESHVITESAKGAHKSKRLIVKNLTQYEHPRGGTHVFRHSHKIRRTARRFMTSQGLSPDNFIGVHIRSEKLGQRDKRIRGFMDKCMKKVVNLSRLFAHKYKHLPIVFLSDYGPGGSDSCFACKGARKLRKIFKHHNITPIHFDASTAPVLLSDQSKPSIHKHSGFVAAVEMELLASSSILVLVGGGTYERQTLLHKYDNISRKDLKTEIVRVCWYDTGLMEPDLIAGINSW